MTSNFTSEYLFKEIQSTNSKNICSLTFMGALLTTAEIWKPPKCPSIDGRIKKLWQIHTTEYYLAITMNKTLPFATPGMDLEGIMLTLHGNI